MILTIIVFLLLLSVLVLVHELGHFLVAKRLGVKVEEFGFGFPPRIWGKKIGETIYSINLLPIGGFVKLFGEDDAGGGKLSLKDSSSIHTKDNKRAFFARPVGQRASIVVAGVVMNTLLAVIIFYIFLGMSNFTTSLPLLGNHTFYFVHQENHLDNTIIVDQVAPHSPASDAGLVATAQIIAINNKQITNTDQVLQLVNENKGKEIQITWEDIKTQKKTTAFMTPRVNPPAGQGAIGVRFGPLAIPIAVLTYQTVPEKIFSGITHPLNLLLYTFDTMGKLISISFQQKSFTPVSEGVSGPVGIASVVGQQLQLPTLKEQTLGLLNLAGLLSISLAFFNALPIPALDGGRLFFILFEAVTRKKVHPKFEGYAHAIGMVILLGLVALVTLHDITRLISNH